jgi:hypothetical protein
VRRVWVNDLELMAQSAAFLIQPLEFLALGHKLRPLGVCIPRKSFVQSRKALCGVLLQSRKL